MVSISNEDALKFLAMSGGKPTTQQHRASHLRLFLDFVLKTTGVAETAIDWAHLVTLRKGGVPIIQIPIDHVFLEEFLTECQTTRTPRVHNDILGVLRQFFAFLVRHGKLSVDPTAHLEAVKLPIKATPRASLTLSEAEALWNAALDRGTRARDFPLVYTLLATGARPSEICNLRPDHVDFERRYLHLNGKVGHRSVPMVDELHQLLQAYISSAWFEEQTAGIWLFPAADLTSQLTTDALGAIIGELTARVGIRPGVTTYWLRHTLATQLYKSGLASFYISGVLGHRKLATTRTYVHERFDRLRDMVNRSSSARMLEEFHRQQFGVVKGGKKK